MSGRSQPCAYCRQHAAVAEYFPFCSERCKMADLGQWLGGSYRVPGAPLDPPDLEHDDADPDLQENDR